MALARFKASNHPQQVAADEIDDRALPATDFEPLQTRFRFTLDAAASDENAKLPRYFTRETNGLQQPWSGERVYCNPPYSKIAPWIEKAWRERTAELIVLLLPANRTEQTWWQELVEPFRDRAGSVLATEFVAGRWRFLKPGQVFIKPNDRPPFGCVLLIWTWAQGPQAASPLLF